MQEAPRSMNIVSQKYDSFLDYHVTMYDNLPYKRDSEYCNAEKIALNSGKVIKYYLCVNQQEERVIDNKDSQIEEILQEAALRLAQQQRQQEIERLPEENPDEVTQEQIQTLLDDNEEAAQTQEDAGDGAEAAPDAVNAFSDVEDW